MAAQRRRSLGEVTGIPVGWKWLSATGRPLLAAAQILLWREDKAEGKCDEWLLCGVKCHNGRVKVGCEGGW
jgi:hypothetical protein